MTRKSEEKNMKYEMSDKKLEIVKVSRERKGKYSKVISEFVKSDKKSLIFYCTNEKEAKSCSTAIRYYKNKHNEDYVFGHGIANQIYVVKA